jgi:hypothetical protein
LRGDTEKQEMIGRDGKVLRPSYKPKQTHYFSR